MARPERPLGTQDGALAEFAGQLRELRRRAGSPSYRSMAATVHFAPTTLSEAASGRRLPSLAVTLAYVGACDGDVEQWRDRWTAVARATSAYPVPAMPDRPVPATADHPISGPRAVLSPWSRRIRSSQPRTTGWPARQRMGSGLR
jgi:hypothetical protein